MPSPSLLARTIVLLCLSLGAVAAQEERPAEKPRQAAILKAEPLAIDPRDDELGRLLKERYNAAVAELKGSLAMYEHGRGNFAQIAHAGRRVLDAGVEIWTTPKDKLVLLASYVELAVDNEKLAKASYNVGQGMQIDVDRATYERVSAQLMLVREKRAAERQPGR